MTRRIKSRQPNPILRLCCGDSYVAGGRGLMSQLNSWGIVFLLLCVIESLGLLGCAIAQIVLNSLLPTPSLSSYFLSSIVMVIMLFMLFFGFEAVFAENHFQLVAFYLVQILLVGRMIAGFVLMHEYEQIPHLIGGVLVFACFLFFTVIVVPLGRSFGWRLFRLVGTNVRLTALFRNYQIFLSLVKLDILAMFCVFVMGIFFIVYQWWISYIGISAGICLNLLLLALVTLVGIKREYRSVCIGFILLGTSLPAYLIYKIVMIWIRDDIIRDISGSTLKDWHIRAMLTSVAGVSIVIRLVLFLWTIVLMTSFGKGLKKVLLESDDAAGASINDPVLPVAGDGYPDSENDDESSEEAAPTSQRPGERTHLVVSSGRSRQQ